MTTGQSQMTDEVGSLTTQADSAEAFAKFVCAHQAAVRWYLMRALRDAAIADDLAQEVFLHVYQRMNEYRGEGSVRAWLLGIARNLALQHVRSVARRRKREKGPLQVQLAEWRMERLSRDPWDDADQEEALAALRGCLNGLAIESQQVVNSHYFDRETIEVIAKRLGRTGGSVRMMLFRIRQSLRDCLRSKLAPRGGHT
ncbi:MAG: sigma-70 family RNA polymerase sigma factor [Zavarzinella sp.]